MKTFLSMVASLFAGSAAAQDDLGAVLERLEAALHTQRPAYAATLRPPLSDAEIAEIEARHGVSLPNPLRALYLWHDGQDSESAASFANGLMFAPLNDMLETKADFDGMIGYDFELENWWHPGWFPVFHNGGGNYLVMDAEGVHTGNAQQLLMFNHDWEKRSIEARSLEAFLQAVLSYYETTAASDMQEPFGLEDHLPKTGQSFKAQGRAQPLD